jgi:hypothetical protein
VEKNVVERQNKRKIGVRRMKVQEREDKENLTR